MKPRNKSLDLFRGFTVFWMVIVNNPGNWGQIYGFFKHAAWDGLGSADFVFPFFLIAVGASIPLAYAKRKSLLESDGRILLHVFIRSIILICIGLILNGFPDYILSELRIPGVLQRIGIVYFLTYLIYLLLNSKLRFILFWCILFIYTYVIVFCPPPNWDYSKNSVFQYDAIFNWAAYIDSYLLSGHLWKITKVWDPEGILSTIPSIATALMGIWLSEWKIFAAGFGFLLLGLIVAIIFPINKSLWSSSFVLVTGGSAYIFLWLLTILPENWQQAKVFNPILLLGQSALFVFVFTGFFSRILNLPLWESHSTKSLIVSYIDILSSSKGNSLLYSFIYLAFTIAITWIWRKVYYRI